MKDYTPRTPETLTLAGYRALAIDRQATDTRDAPVNAPDGAVIDGAGEDEIEFIRRRV